MLLRLKPAPVYAQNMRLRLIALLVFFFIPFGASAAVYTWLDAEGNVVYSDQKPPSGTHYRLVRPKPLPTVPASSLESPSVLAPSSSITPHKKISRPKVLILSPTNEAAIRANGGMLEVKLKISPPLVPGQMIRLYLDGHQVHTGREASIALKNLDRGEHKLYAVVIASSGDEISRSQTITFFLLRHSFLFKKPQTPLM